MGTTPFTGQASAVSEVKQLIGLAWRGPAACIGWPLVLVLAFAVLLPLAPAPDPGIARPLRISPQMPPELRRHLWLRASACDAASRPAPTAVGCGRARGLVRVHIADEVW